MESISLEAFDVPLRGRLSHWILPSRDSCGLPPGFQDQLITGNAAFQYSILLLSKQDSRSWNLSFPWDMTFTPETANDWSLLLSIIGHLKTPLLIVGAPLLQVHNAFWQKCMMLAKVNITFVSLMYPDSANNQISHFPMAIFFPKLDLVTDTQFIKMVGGLPTAIQQSIGNLDLRSIYRELRGSGASLCLSLVDSSRTAGTRGVQQNGTMPIYNATWFYPETNGALRLHLSDIRMALRTITDGMAIPS
jgi:hypothetical protein